MIGVGSDLVDIARMRAALARTPGLRERLFRPDEQAYAEQKSDPTERYAARFAAKEAVMKSLGLGLGQVAMFDIEVVRTPSGAPEVLLHGQARAVAEARGVTRFHLSLTHSQTSAHAIVVAE